jgi:hypothetical protein
VAKLAHSLFLKRKEIDKRKQQKNKNGKEKSKQ